MQTNRKRRVAVTGIGAVTPLGNTMDNTWNGIIEGISVAGPIKKFDATKFPCKIAYEVDGFKFDSSLVVGDEERFLNISAQYGLHAANEAWNQAGLDPEDASTRRAVCVGVGMGSPGFDWYRDVFIPENWDDPTMRNHIRFYPNQFGSVLARSFGAKGMVSTIHTACASSGQSLGEAYELIASGKADVCLTGGADSMVNPYYLAGFSLLGALSNRNDDPKTASRPFDKDRNGFVLGEGACMLVFEDWDHAVDRGAKIIGELCGYGITESAYRITDLHPEGRGPIEAMEMAVADAGIRAADVGYVNAHGTSTSLNDRIETLAVSKVFPESTRVSSTKSMTGHMISAAGAIECAVCLKAIEHQVLPPTVNVFEKDPEITVQLTDKTPQETNLKYALSNSVGFGGSNTALVVGRV